VALENSGGLLRATVFLSFVYKVGTDAGTCSASLAIGIAGCSGGSDAPKLSLFFKHHLETHCGGSYSDGTCERTDRRRGGV